MRADAPSYVFPDASVTCESVSLEATEIVSPRFVLDVISEASVQRDKFAKLEMYRAIETLSEYLILDSRTCGRGCIAASTGRRGLPKLVDVDSLYADLGL